MVEYVIRDVEKTNNIEEYREKHKEYYMQEIKLYQTASYDLFANIPKVNINNHNIKDSLDIVHKYLNDNNHLRGESKIYGI